MSENGAMPCKIAALKARHFKGIVTVGDREMQAMHPLALSGMIFAALGLTSPAQAQIATEVSELQGYTITLHLHDFLSPDDIEVLRFVAKSKEGLAMFVPGQGGFAAMAVSPKEGFTQAGLPVTSAAARSGLSDAETAATEAVKACQVAAKAPDPCMVILEVAPKS